MRKEQKALLVVLFGCILSYMIPFLFPCLILLRTPVPMNQDVNAEGVNGILTISAIIFGFSSIGTYGKSKFSMKQWLVLLLIFAVQVIAFMLISLDYYDSLVRYNVPTISTLTFAIVTLLLNIASWFSLRLAKIYWEME